MRRTNPWLLVLTLALLLMMAAPALARQTSTDVPIDGGYSIRLPNGWSSLEWDEPGTAFTNGSAQIVVFGPEAMQTLTRRGMRSSPRNALIAAYESLYDETIAEEDIDIGLLAGQDAAFWYFVQGEDQEGVFEVIALEQALKFIGFEAVTPLGELDTASNQIAPMVRSVLEGTGASGSGAAQPVSTEPCTVSTSAADSARLRVGPGFNRTSVAFLPAGRVFDVIGQATADDDSVWFKLDKDEAAPQSAAGEVWVLSEEVETQGSCDAVDAVGGSPIIPIMNAPPAAPPETQSGGSTNDAAPASASTVPLGGTWTVTFASQSNASCAGYQNVVLPTTDVWEGWTERDYVWTATLIVNGSTSFTFDGDGYMANGGNEYVGNWEFGGSLNTYLYWRVSSATSMTGTMTGNIIAPDGVACSGTTAFSARHR
ncbi:MAG: hypothetical protein IH587_03115 [Anaerolineae bacterium]|nr:hypothetical protein [Anaerolineae bacterium]